MPARPHSRTVQSLSRSSARSAGSRPQTYRAVPVLAFGLLALSAVVAWHRTAVSAEKAEATDATTIEQRLTADVSWLADDAREGRGVGTQGLVAAGEYIREQFAAAGLDVTRASGTAFQTFDMVTGAEAGKNNALTLTGADGKPVTLKRGTDFEVCSFGGAGEFSGQVVFAGYGIDDKDSEYSDFTGVDVKGHIALIIRRNPQQGNPHSPFAGPHGSVSRHAELRTKISHAYSRGATAVLLVNDPYSSRKAVTDARERLQKVKDQLAEAADAWQADKGDDPETATKLKKAFDSAVSRYRAAKKDAAAGPPDDLMKFGYGGKKEQTEIPVVHITQAAANRLLEPALKKTLVEIETAIDEDLKPQSALLAGVSVAGQTDITRNRADVRNVIGVLEGSGPLADETIVIGAHSDHVGRGGPDSGSLARGSREVHNGADDNASGSAALLELARRFGALAKEKPLPRRMVFIAFTAEELGLIGSARYVREPLFPLDKTIAMFNMDMVGRLKDNKLTVFGTGTAPVWKPLIEELGQKYEFQVTQKPDGFGPSDHSSFYAKKIPVLHFFTGTHSDYHRPSDDVDLINAAGMRRVVALIEDAVLRTLDTPDRPEYVAVKQSGPARRGGSRPYFGSIPDFGREGRGYHISGVAPGSPAAKGGLKGGDAIVGLGDSRVSGLGDFDLALRKYKQDDEVKVTVLRDGKEVELTVILGKPR